MKAQRGVNLIELIVAIVVVSIAISGVLLAFTQAVRFSADPMLEQQAAAIAEGYLDEILARPVDDPNGGELQLGTAEAGEVRATFDDIKDYSTIVNQSPPQDQSGAPLAGMNAYTVTVTVTPDVSIGPAGAQILAARVDVTVTQSALVTITLTGYRAN